MQCELFIANLLSRLDQTRLKHQTNKGDSRHSGHGRLKFAKEKNYLYYRLIFF